MCCAPSLTVKVPFRPTERAADAEDRAESPRVITEVEDEPNPWSEFCWGAIQGWTAAVTLGCLSLIGVMDAAAVTICCNCPSVGTISGSTSLIRNGPASSSSATVGAGCRFVLTSA